MKFSFNLSSVGDVVRDRVAGGVLPLHLEAGAHGARQLAGGRGGGRGGARHPAGAGAAPGPGPGPAPRREGALRHPGQRRHLPVHLQQLHSVWAAETLVLK